MKEVREFNVVNTYSIKRVNKCLQQRFSYTATPMIG